MHRHLSKVVNWKSVAVAASFRPAIMAAHCSVSLRELERFFTEQFEKTPRDWIREMRFLTAHLPYPITGSFLKLFSKEPFQFAKGDGTVSRHDCGSEARSDGNGFPIHHFAQMPVHEVPRGRCRQVLTMNHSG